MKYSNKQYASSLLAALSEKNDGERKQILKNFLEILARSGDSSKKNQILAEAKKIYYAQNKISEVKVETAGHAPHNLKRDLEEVLGREVVLEEKTNPGIIGGVKIVIDDETLIDASLKTQLDRIFQRTPR